MTNEERKYFAEYVEEVFHYEHQCSTEILARVLLLCELLIDKGVLSDSDIMETLSLENIAAIMKELNYGDDTWKPKGENHERT